MRCSRRCSRIAETMKTKLALTIACCGLLGAGCSVISYNRVFPKLVFYWSAEAKEQRRQKEAHKLIPPETKTKPLAEKIAKRDGTNYLGVYMGMIAEWDGWKTNYTGSVTSQGVMMFSATSGELLKWISAEDFTNIFILKNRPEYP